MNEAKELAKQRADLQRNYASRLTPLAFARKATDPWVITLRPTDGHGRDLHLGCFLSDGHVRENDLMVHFTKELLMQSIKELDLTDQLPTAYTVYAHRSTEANLPTRHWLKLLIVE